MKTLIIFFISILLVSGFSSCRKGEGPGATTTTTTTTTLSPMIPTAGHMYVRYKPGRAENIAYGAPVFGVFSNGYYDMNGIYGYGGHGGDDLKDQTDNLWNTVANQFYSAYGYNAPDNAFCIDMLGSVSDPCYPFVASGIGGYILNPGLRFGNPNLQLQLQVCIGKVIERLKNSTDPDDQKLIEALSKNPNSETKHALEQGEFR